MRGLLFILSFSVVLTLQAIDSHFSQFYSSPLTLNPALTGVSFGNYRLSANYRNQWSAITPFQTYSLSVDGSLFENKRKYDFAGVGLLITRDSPGLSLSELKLMASFSYHKALDKNATQYIVMGIQGGIDQKSLDLSGLTSQQQWDLGSLGFDPSVTNGENPNSLSLLRPDFQVGILWYSFLGKYSSAFAGASVFHITEPRESFIGTSHRLPMRYLFHAGSKLNWGGKISIVPNMIFMQQNKVTELNMGASTEMDLARIFNTNPFQRADNTDYRILSAGIWYRNKDAIIVAASFEYNQVKVGVSYDANVSRLNEIIGTTGGFEFSITYNFSKYNSKTTHLATSPCPRL